MLAKWAVLHQSHFKIAFPTQVSQCRINQTVSVFSHLLSVTITPLLYSCSLLQLSCLWPLKPCQIELVIISFFLTEGTDRVTVCVCKCVYGILTIVLSASIIHKVSAVTPHAMLGGESERQSEGKSHGWEGPCDTVMWQKYSLQLLVPFYIFY